MYNFWHIGWGYCVLLYYFRLSLKEVGSPDALGAIDFDGTPFTRERWLRVFFSAVRSFEHRSQPFTFIPADDAPTSIPSHLIVGWIARPRVVSERTPPSAGFEPTEHNSWQGALIVVDPTEHEDGQKVALELRSDVGKPLSVLRSLTSEMYIGDDPRPFDVQVHPIVEPASFWRFAEQHEYRINMLAFDVAPPNMFRGRDSFTGEMRFLRDHVRVNRVRSTLTSETVLDVQQENIKEVIDYTERGAGTIKAKTTNNVRYNSNDHAKYEALDTEQNDEGFWAKVNAWLGERF